MYFLESQNPGHCIPVDIMQIIISYKQLSHICVILLTKKYTLTVSLSKSKVHHFFLSASVTQTTARKQPPTLNVGPKWQTHFEHFSSFCRAGWMRYKITTQKRTIRPWLTPCSLPWRDPVSDWTTHAPTSAAGPRTKKKSSMPVLSSHTAFSSQRAK